MSLPIHASRTRTWAVRWLSRGSWALADQGLFSGSGFLLNILLARWLGACEYGAFSICFSVFLLAGVLHAALVADPMTVFACGRYSQHANAYLKALSFGQGIFGLVLALLVAVAGACLWMLGLRPVASGLLAMAFWLPCILTLWMARRVCYVLDRPGEAASAGAVYLAVAISCLFIFLESRMLVPATAWAAIGLGSLASGVYLLARLGLVEQPTREGYRLCSLAREHWRYGRWVAGSSAAGFVSGQIGFFLLPAFAGLEGIAVLRSLVNLLMPMYVVNNAFSALLLPRLARSRDSSGRCRRLLRGLVLVGAGGLIYWLILGLGHSFAARWLYAGRFTEHASLAWVVGLAPMLSGLAGVLACALAADERSDGILTASVAACLVCSPLACWLIARYGLAGAAWSVPVYGTVSVLSLALVLCHHLRRKGTSDFADTPQRRGCPADFSQTIP